MPYNGMSHPNMAPFLNAYDRAKHLTDSLEELETLSRLTRRLSPSHVVLFKRFLDLIPLTRMPLALYSYIYSLYALHLALSQNYLHETISTVRHIQ